VLLVLGGADGPVGPPELPAGRAKAHPREVEVRVLPGVGHLLNVEAADTVNAALLAFLRGTAPSLGSAPPG
jgi:pimeloyl-ACP methyl ester carboxylesterase